MTDQERYEELLAEVIELDADITWRGTELRSSARKGSVAKSLYHRTAEAWAMGPLDAPEPEVIRHRREILRAPRS